MDGGAAPASRAPQIWTFRDRPAMKFQGGQVQIEFDENCQLPQGARLGDQLNRIAEGRIVKPDLNYRRGGDNKIVKLVDQLPKPTPVMALLKAPRQDFTTAAEANMFLRTTGGTYVAGLVHAPAGTVAVQDQAGKKVGGWRWASRPWTKRASRRGPGNARRTRSRGRTAPCSCPTVSRCGPASTR